MRCLLLLVEEQSRVLRRTKTISAGQRLHLDSVGSRQSTPRIRSYISPGQNPTASSTVENWFTSTRRVQIVSPSASPGVCPATTTTANSSMSPGGISHDSSADQQPTGGAESDSAIGAGSSLERRTHLRRNAYPPRYVKRAVPQQQQQQQQQLNQSYANGSVMGSSQRWYTASEMAEMGELQNMSAQ